jgi:hypothetical protein
LDGGTAEAISARTDSFGVASARWTLGKQPGIQRLRAQVGGGSGGRSIPPVTISARAKSGAPAGVVLVSGDAQRGIAGATLSRSLVLRVVDANGNSVADATLTLFPSGGSLPDSSLHTDSLGRANVRWTMGHSAGDYTLGVKLEGVKQLLRTAAHAAPAAPANLEFDEAPLSPSERRAHGEEKGKRFYALVTDMYGNPVSEAKLNFTAKSGSVTPSRAVSDARGRATLVWTPGTTTAEQTLVGIVRETDVRGAATLAARHEPVARPVSLKKPSK